MQYKIAALALALSVSAQPHWRHHRHGGNGGGNSLPYSIPAGDEPTVDPTFGGYPSETAGPVPTGGSPTVGPIGGTGSVGPVGTGTGAPFPIPSSSAPYPTVSSVASPEEPEPSVSAPASSSYAAPIPTYGYAVNSSSSAVEAEPTSSAPSEEAPEPTYQPSTPASGGSGSGGSLPASSGTSALSSVQTIAAGDSFDGGMVMYDRGQSCTGQEEGGDSDAVFILENGASLSNVIIGPNQIEGVHCQGACTLTNVWWSAVCEDAFSIKEQADGETTNIIGGGAFGAEDKVIQHNGGGTVSISGFTVGDFGKLYRSCGNCDEMPQRHVIMDDITASEGSVLAGVNGNFGDTATLTNIKVSGVDDICDTYEGNDTGDEPSKISSGPSEACLYSESDITEI